MVQHRHGVHIPMGMAHYKDHMALSTQGDKYDDGRSVGRMLGNPLSHKLSNGLYRNPANRSVRNAELDYKGERCDCHELLEVKTIVDNLRNGCNMSFGSKAKSSRRALCS